MCKPVDELDCVFDTVFESNKLCQRESTAFAVGAGVEIIEKVDEAVDVSFDEVEQLIVLPFAGGEAVVESRAPAHVAVGCLDVVRVR